MIDAHLARQLEAAYLRLNRRSMIAPDPLQWVWAYEDDADREVVGLIAACLAFGAVEQIVKTVGGVLERMPSPAAWLLDADRRKMERVFAGFRYRFVDQAELIQFLLGIRGVLRRHGSLRTCFLEGAHSNDETIRPALESFVRALRIPTRTYLLPSPEGGSACKRLNLFLRWMVRHDEVDPGCWHGAIPASKLIVPLDLHIHRFGLYSGLTQRKQGNWRTALEITEAFRSIAPEDPCRYDFTLAHMGMRGETNDLEVRRSSPGAR